MDRRIFSNIASAERIRHRMWKTGRTMKGQPLWTERETALLRHHYPDYRAAIRALPGRSYSSLRHKARELGLTPKRHCWTGADRVRFRRLYPTASHDELRDAFYGFTIPHIRCTANRFGIYRDRRPFKPTGHPLIDCIRARCFDLRYSMVDLDDLAGTGSYFARQGWRGSLNHRAIARAIDYLDGTTYVRWDDDEREAA